MTVYDNFFIPRILLLSDGEADSRNKWREPLQHASQQGIIIDVVALLSQNEKGRNTLEEIAKKTNGDYIMPSTLSNFIKDFVHLSKKKHAQKVEDIVLCLDVSGSMSEKYKGSSEKKINALKEAVMKFSKEKLSIDPRDRVAVVAFGTHDSRKVGVLMNPMPYNKEKLEDVVSNLKAQNGTPLTKGLETAITVLNVKGKRTNTRKQMVIPQKSIEELPQGTNSCKYCEATGKSTPGITPENWHFFEGTRGIMVFKCPVCNSLYHGMCFDKHVTRGGNAGVCYGCNAVIGVEGDLAIQTPESAGGNLLLCPQCNEPLPANARFCGYCGYRLSGSEMANTATEAVASGPLKSSVDSYYVPNEGELVNCPSCGYTCQKSWGECPMCGEKLS